MSQSSHEVKHVEGSFEIRFNGFAELSAVRGVSAYSPEVQCFGQTWAVSIYPGGQEVSEDGIVALVIWNRSNQSITIRYSYSIRNSAGRELLSHDRFDDEEPRLLGSHCGSSMDNFALRSTLLGALIEGALVIEVRIRLIDTQVGIPPRPFLIENPLRKNMEKLFNDEDSADVVFEVGADKEENNHKRASKRKKQATTLFHAHLFLIKDGAPTLYELCKSGGKIQIHHVTSEVFGDLLFYLYGGELCEVALAMNARKFIDAADRYGAVHLKLKAEAEYVKMPIGLDDAMEKLLYADSKNCALLKEAVMDFLVENKEEAIEQISFDAAPGYLMKELLAAVAARDRKKDPSSSDANSFSTMRVDALRKNLHEKELDIDGSREAMIELLKTHS